MKNLLRYFVTATLLLISLQAQAELNCSVSSLDQGTKNTVSVFNIPDSVVGSATLSLNGFDINVTADRYHVPNTLKLTISGPHGTVTTDANSLSSVDANGDGVMVECY